MVPAHLAERVANRLQKPEPVAFLQPVVTADALRRAGMIAWDDGGSRISDELRRIRGQVLRMLADDIGASAPTNLVLVTSAKPGEGKSFTALNLAASIARQHDHEALLIDLNFQPDCLAARLGLLDAPGVLDLLADAGSRPEEVIAETDLGGLSILPLGSHAEQSAEWLSTHQMSTLLHNLARRQPSRVVILDAPSCLSSSDPSNFASLVGQIIMVVQAGATQRHEVEAALDLVQSCPAITLLLNKVPLAERR